MIDRMSGSMRRNQRYVSVSSYTERGSSLHKLPCNRRLFLIVHLRAKKHIDSSTGSAATNSPLDWVINYSRSSCNVMFQFVTNLSFVELVLRTNMVAANDMTCLTHTLDTTTKYDPKLLEWKLIMLIWMECNLEFNYRTEIVRRHILKKRIIW